MRLYVFAAFLSLFLWFSASTAFAACSAPTARAGTMDYFTAPENMFKFCNGTDWIPMGSSLPQCNVGQGLVMGAETWGCCPNMDLSNWSQNNPMNSQHIAYGNGTFVTLSQGGTINGTPIPLAALYSTDGVSWTPIPTMETIGWYSLIYANGQFIATNFSGVQKIATSPDGINWTFRTGPSGFYANGGMAYGNGTYVGVQSNGDVAISPDGTTWSLHSLPTEIRSQFWKTITFGNGRFIAVSSNGTTQKAATSTDGVNWTALDTPTGFGSYITFGKGLFMVAGLGIHSSSDGTNWVERVPAQASFPADARYINGYFIATPGSNRKFLLFSSDGVNWTNINLPDKPSSSSWNSIAYGHGRFLVATAASAGNQQGLLQSLTLPCP